MKYRFIQMQRTHYPVTRLCFVLGVSTSGYYGWCNRVESVTTRWRRKLIKQISRIFLENKQVYGSPRIHAELAEQGEKVCVNTVAKLMRQNDIQSKVFRRFVVTTNSRHTLAAAPNRLNRGFKAVKANEKWVSDVSFITTREGWLYLAAVMDLFSRKIIGWSMGNRHNTQLVIAALEMAIARRGEVRNVLLHSDRGIQYASKVYRDKLAEYGIACSMSRKGDCWDNAPMESFFHTLKTECVNFEDYKTRSQARRNLFDYIELFYNRRRKHSTINYMSLATFENAAGVH
ncbi:IS3 family transposase [Aliikangiella coralliicola]|uniref:IS3 family transposase n=1 Tax=Aliikangiella coralliicola TaxID=2592383 RepID=UPI00143DB3DD|nr:IS3 family transposase [Aliikangiella coralliicola]